jgi:hypothetical protein
LTRAKDGLIFHGPRGGVLKPDTVGNILVRDVLTPRSGRFPTPPGEAGFLDGRLHSCRHYFASQCAALGISEQVVMAWLGHLPEDGPPLFPPVQQNGAAANRPPAAAGRRRRRGCRRPVQQGGAGGLEEDQGEEVVTMVISAIDWHSAGTVHCANRIRGTQTPIKVRFTETTPNCAEREGFEPSVHFRVHSISSAAQSTTLPPLRAEHDIYPPGGLSMPRETVTSARSRADSAARTRRP